MNNKTTIKRNFSRYAPDYDAHSSVQNQLAAELIASATGNFNSILDIGCGTGNYTALLANKFPAANITAIDISSSMIDIARQKLRDKKTTFITADAETATFDQHFDLVTSNACFQWFADFDKAVAKYKNLLSPNGTILFSTFGPKTFYQLSESLSQLYETDLSLAAASFLDIDALSEILEKNFTNISINEQITEKTYTSLWELLTTIKYTGTSGTGINGQKLTKTRITQLEKIYKEKFNAITATHQVFYCRAKRKD